jgi:hypothetical protein
MFKLFLLPMLLINMYAQDPSGEGIQGVKITQFILDKYIPYQVGFSTSGDDVSKFDTQYCDLFCKYNRFYYDPPSPEWREHTFQVLMNVIENKWLINITYCQDNASKKVLYGVVCGVGIQLNP